MTQKKLTWETLKESPARAVSSILDSSQIRIPTLEDLKSYLNMGAKAEDEVSLSTAEESEYDGLHSSNVSNSSLAKHNMQTSNSSSCGSGYNTDTESEHDTPLNHQDESDTETEWTALSEVSSKNHGHSKAYEISASLDSGKGSKEVTEKGSESLLHLELEHIGHIVTSEHSILDCFSLDSGTVHNKDNAYPSYNAYPPYNASREHFRKYQSSKSRRSNEMLTKISNQNEILDQSDSQEHTGTASTKSSFSSKQSSKNSVSTQKITKTSIQNLIPNRPDTQEYKGAVKSNTISCPKKPDKTFPEDQLDIRNETFLAQAKSLLQSHENDEKTRIDKIDKWNLMVSSNESLMSKQVLQISSLNETVTKITNQNNVLNGSNSQEQNGTVSAKPHSGSEQADEIFPEGQLNRLSRTSLTMSTRQAHELVERIRQDEIDKHRETVSSNASFLSPQESDEKISTKRVNRQGRTVAAVGRNQGETFHKITSNDGMTDGNGTFRNAQDKKTLNPEGIQNSLNQIKFPKVIDCRVEMERNGRDKTKTQNEIEQIKTLANLQVPPQKTELVDQKNTQKEDKSKSKKKQKSKDVDKKASDGKDNKQSAEKSTKQPQNKDGQGEERDEKSDSKSEKPKDETPSKETEEKFDCEKYLKSLGTDGCKAKDPCALFETKRQNSSCFGGRRSNSIDCKTGSYQNARTKPFDCDEWLKSQKTSSANNDFYRKKEVSFDCEKYLNSLRTNCNGDFKSASSKRFNNQCPSYGYIMNQEAKSKQAFNCEGLFKPSRTSNANCDFYLKKQSGMDFDCDSYLKSLRSSRNDCFNNEGETTLTASFRMNVPPSSSSKRFNNQCQSYDFMSRKAESGIGGNNCPAYGFVMNQEAKAKQIENSFMKKLSPLSQSIYSSDMGRNTPKDDECASKNPCSVDEAQGEIKISIPKGQSICFNVSRGKDGNILHCEVCKCEPNQCKTPPACCEPRKANSSRSSSSESEEEVEENILPRRAKKEIKRENTQGHGRPTAVILQIDETDDEDEFSEGEFLDIEEID